jgi:hypothetical protein
VNIGESDYVLAEHPNQTNTLYYYVIYGSGKLGIMFEKEIKVIGDKEFVNVKDTLSKYRIFHSLEDFYLIGFNTLDKSIDWDGRLITNDESTLIIENPNSYFVCLNGNVSINDKQFKRFDYASLNVGKEYQIKIAENSALGLFSKLN